MIVISKRTFWLNLKLRFSRKFREEYERKQKEIIRASMDDPNVYMQGHGWL